MVGWVDNYFPQVHKRFSLTNKVHFLFPFDIFYFFHKYFNFITIMSSSGMFKVHRILADSSYMGIGTLNFNGLGQMSDWMNFYDNVVAAIDPDCRR